MHFTNIDDLRNPETEALRFAISLYMLASWKNIEDVKLHSARDMIIEGWLMGVVNIVFEHDYLLPTKGYCV